MARTLSKTRVANLTRDIRREADKVRAITEVLDKSAKEHGTDIPSRLSRFPDVQSMLEESLNIIDGNSALLREALGLEV